MLTLPKALTAAALLLGSALALASHASAAGLSATAIYTYAQTSPGVYSYSIVLNNTGTTTIGTYWLGWVPGAGFLSPAPLSFQTPAGWVEKTTNTGAAIQWTTTTNLLAAGQSLSGFGFSSTETPAQLALNFTGTGTGAGDPVTTSFVYIAAPLGDAGAQLVTTPAPEPGTLLLTLTGFGLVAVSFNLRSRNRRAGTPVTQ